MNAGQKTSALHFDSHDAMINQFDGEKEVLLIDPAESHKLYTDFPSESSGDDARLSYSKFGYSPIEPHSVNLCRYPAAADAAFYNVTIGPGDTLYIPPIWWHIVVSLPRPARHSAPLAGRTVGTTLQGDFLAQDTPSDVMSAAGLQWAVAMNKGCRVGRKVYTQPEEDTEFCNVTANSRRTHPLRWHFGRWMHKDSSWLAPHQTAPRWSCVRAPPWNQLFASASPSEFVQRAFTDESVRVPVKETPCQTWVKTATYSLALHFGAQAFVIGLEGGGALYAGTVAEAPVAEVVLNCESFDKFVRFLQWSHNEFSLASSREYNELSVRAERFSSSCTAELGPEAQIGTDVDQHGIVETAGLACLREAPDDVACKSQLAAQFLEQVERMLYGYWGRVHLSRRSLREYEDPLIVRLYTALSSYVLTNRIDSRAASES